MEYRDLIRRRYSCRAYRPDPVADDVLERILDAGRLAPTAHNRQPFRIVVIPTASHREALGRIYRRAWLRDAPLVVCIVGRTAEGWVRKDGRCYLDVDCAIVMDHIILAATNEGLGSCWIGAFDAAAAREAMQLSPEEEPIALTPLGHPADEPPRKERKPLSALVRRLS
jgi:nitroreductase